MAVEPTDENRNVSCGRVDPFPGWQRCARPAFVVPSSASDPAPRLEGFSEASNALGELLRRIGVVQFHTSQLKTAGKKMDVRIVKSRQHEPSIGIDNPRLRPGQRANLLAAANSHNSV